MFIRTTRAAVLTAVALNGTVTVVLSGFAKNTTEKNSAGSIAASVKGVKQVKNEVAVRP